MPFLKKLSFALLCVTLTSPLLAQELLLNGISTFSRLKIDYYITALYLPETSNNTETILEMPGVKRMEMRVLTRRLSSRKFSEIWNTAINLNNPPSIVSASQKDILTFTSTVKKKLTTGDKITFLHTAAGNTEIKINNVTLTVITNKKFYTMLLNAWIGSRPPSRVFKQEMLNLRDRSPAIGQFNALTYAISRQKEITTWIPKDPKKQQEQLLADKLAKEKSIAAEKAEAAAKAKAQALANTKAEAAARVKEEAEILARDVAKAATIALAKTEALALAKATKDAQEKVALLSTNKTETKALTNVKVEEAQKKTIEKAKPHTAKLDKAGTPEQEKTKLTVKALSAAEIAKESVILAEGSEQKNNIKEHDKNSKEQLIRTATSKYKTALLRETYKYISYPRRASARRQEGVIILNVTIDESGNVTDIDIEKKSRYSLLNKAALNAVKRAAPYPDIPAELTANKYTFRIPIQFRLP